MDSALNAGSAQNARAAQRRRFKGFKILRCTVLQMPGHNNVRGGNRTQRVRGDIRVSERSHQQSTAFGKINAAVQKLCNGCSGVWEALRALLKVGVQLQRVIFSAGLIERQGALLIKNFHIGELVAIEHLLPGFNTGQLRGFSGALGPQLPRLAGQISSSIF